MTRSLNRIGALLVLACALPMAGVASAQPGYGPGGHGGPGQHREYRESKRLESYSIDVLRNNRKECSVLRNVREERGGRIIAECLSNNKSRELTYSIDPMRGHRGARVALVSNQHNRDMKYRDGYHLDRR